jgi:hypothetical protein
MMKTPFDGAIRVGQREIDEMRIAISVEVDQLVKIETAQIAHEREIRRQRDVVGDDVLLSSHAYLARMRGDQARLKENQAIIDNRLAQLRAKAVTAYGTLKGVSSAAESWCGDAEQAIANAEQGHLDDLSNANFVRDSQLARKGRA